MTERDDIADLFAQAAPTWSPDHRDRVFADVLAAAEAGGGLESATSSTERSDEGKDPTGTLAAVTPLRPRRSPLLWLSVAAAAVVISGIAGVLVGRRDAKVVVTSAESTSTTSPSASSPDPSSIPTGAFTVDATKVASTGPIVVATMAPIAVGDFAYGLGRTPDGSIYFAGYDAYEPTAFRVDVFDQGATSATRYDLPASFLRKNPDGSLKYRGWTLGPARVLYGYEYETAADVPIYVIAVPTSGRRASQVVAKEAVASAVTCERSPTGIRCGSSVVRTWVDAQGATLGQRFDGDWYDFDVAHEVQTFDAAPANDATDTGVTVPLENGATVTFTNLYRAFLNDGPPQMAGVSTSRAIFGGRACAIANISWEGGGPTFVACPKADGSVASTTFGPLTGSLPGGNVELLTDDAYYTIASNDTETMLVKFPLA